MAKNKQNNWWQNSNSAYEKGFRAGQDDMDGDFGESFDDSNSFFGRNAHKYRDDYYAGYEDGREGAEDEG